MNTIATHGIGPHIYANLGYDPVKDFEPVILVAKLPLIMVVNAELPLRIVADVIALAKAKPGELTFCSSGAGGAPHLAGEMFKHETGTELQHVPYRGSGPAVIDLIAGRITMMFDATPSLLPTSRPASSVPSPPQARSGIGCFRTSPRSPSSATPAWTSRSGMASWSPAARRADRATAQCRTRQNRRHARRAEEPAEQGADLQGGSLEDFEAFMRNESARWGVVVTQAGINPSESSPSSRRDH